MFHFGLTHSQISTQVASLINTHNQLSKRRSASDIQLGSIDYVVETHGTWVLGAIGVDRQGYTFTEVKHLVVRPDWRGRGVAKHLLGRALDMVSTRMVFATIREGNEASLKLFKSRGFAEAGGYPTANHNVLVLVRASSQWKQTKSDSKLRWYSGENGLELWSDTNP